MRISGIEAIAIDVPLRKNFGGSTYAVIKRSTVITRLLTEDGLVSEVYNGDNREAGREIVRLMREELGPMVPSVRARTRGKHAAQAGQFLVPPVPC